MSAQGSSEGRVSFARRAWRVARWVLLILVVAYVALIVFRLPSYQAEQKSKATVEIIKSQHLTLADVDGKHLPPPPDPKQVDATVAGIDANQNGIRDDVELAIFKRYPNSPYTRTAELQYAMTEQMYLTVVSDTQTWKTVAEEDGRASMCLSTIGANNSSGLRKEVEDLVFNTPVRKAGRENAYNFITSHGSATGDVCDVNASNLSN